VSTTAGTAAAHGLPVRTRALVHVYRGEGRDVAALAGVDLTVRAGEMIGLLGPSGAGKSTLLSLLLGFRRPDAGRVTINGVDLATIDPEELRRHIAWIGQTPMLFHGTLRENIRLGRPEADDAAVTRAAAEARVMEFAAGLPQGLDTMVGERGVGLSGGQAQRVALARAFLKDAPLVLLDEPTASLDRETEAEILEAIRRLAHGRTAVVATHSPAAMAVASRRILLDQGRIQAEAA
jgi:ATP-binding cassette, subfamily C, bacterial CydD